MPHLLLARHGNTFESGQIATWVGARSDFPLTAKGEEQGEALATLIHDHFLPLGALIAGPLKRTRRVAERIAERTQSVLTVDERLTEIDYGLWENKSSDEIRETYGEAILRGWEENGTWPTTMNWAPSEEKLIHNIQSFLDEQHKSLEEYPNKNRVAITSNGILRFVYKLLTGNPPGPEAKVKTGHYGLLTPTPQGWIIKEWNAKP